MKKLFVFLMVAVMSLSLIGCSGDDTPASDPENIPPANQASEDPLAEEQAKADADHDQLVKLAQGITEYANMSAETAALIEKHTAGEVDDNALLENYKKRADVAQSLLEAVESAQWQTEYYKAQVELLTASYQALADAERLVYEAGLENDESKLAEAEKAFEEYEVKIDEFLTSMGV